MKNFDRRFVLICLVVGSVLRLIWPLDMEWKFDEQNMFRLATQALEMGKLPWVGMPSGAGVPNPGLSVWPFVFFRYFSASPLFMVQGVQLLNIAALWLFFGLFRKKIAPNAQWPWLMGLALFAVSPLPVLWSRKIWAQNLLPFFGFFWIWAHFNRDKFLGAFFWGLVGALLGQIHMSGFFAAFSLFLVSAFYDYRARLSAAPKSCWRAWVLGSGFGALPLVPWLLHRLNDHVPETAKLHTTFWEIFTLKFYTQTFGDIWGLNLKYTLKEVFFKDFIFEPRVFGFSTGLIGVLSLFLLAAGSYLTVKFFVKFFVNFSSKRKSLALDPTLKLYLVAFFLVCGALLQLSKVSVQAHYLIVLSPFLHVWAAWISQPHPKLWRGVVAAEALISIFFLIYIHRHGGCLDGADYGRSYGLQMGLR